MGMQANSHKIDLVYLFRLVNNIKSFLEISSWLNINITELRLKEVEGILGHMAQYLYNAGNMCLLCTK